ncbi:hypothetical protein FKM82_029483 [Ascaphus truei]
MSTRSPLSVSLSRCSVIFFSPISPSLCVLRRYVLECCVCGIIYRSRQYWYGNRDPDGSIVRQEVRHVWSGSEALSADHHNAAQRVLDGVNVVIQSVSEYSARPTHAVTSWLTDRAAPAYWRPNAQITVSASGCDAALPALETERSDHSKCLRM